MAATRIVKIKTAASTLHDGCRTPISGPIKSDIMSIRISSGDKGRQGSAEQQSLGNSLRRGKRKWGYRESRGNNERTHECHAHLLCSLCVRIRDGNGIEVRLFADCFEKQSHLDGAEGCFIALVVNARAAAINRLLFGVQGEHTKHHWYAS